MQDSADPEIVLPLALFLSPIEWSLDEDIPQATLTEPAPPGDPEGKIYVPTTLRLSLLDTHYSSLGSGHPGSGRTLSLLQNRYWWPNMAREVSQFTRSCSVCAPSNSTRHQSHCKLVPLPMPCRPWSHRRFHHLIVVDRFSKACKLFPLPELPTSIQTAE